MEDIELTLENALTYSGKGIVKNADAKLRVLLEEVPAHDIRRAMMYLSTRGSHFELPRIGREGGGTKQVVSVYDVGAYHLIMKISLLYPSALQRVSGNALRFHILIGPLLWHVKEIVTEHLNVMVPLESSAWGEIRDDSGREPWSHQLSSIEEMKNSYNLGRKGHFIWINVGLGKTLIVLSYIQWLESICKLPKYIIYTLPSSAISSIRKEIEAFGIKCKLLVPLKKLNNEYTKNGKPMV